MNNSVENFEKIYTELRQWCEDEILYLRCIKSCTDKIEQEIINYCIGDELKVFDVTCNNGEIDFWVDSGDVGAEFIIPFDSEEFEFFLRYEDDAED